MMQMKMLQKCISPQVQKGIYMPIWEKKGTIKGNKYRQEIAKFQGKTIFELSIAKSILNWSSQFCIPVTTFYLYGEDIAMKAIYFTHPKKQNQRASK